MFTSLHYTRYICFPKYVCTTCSQTATNAAILHQAMDLTIKNCLCHSPTHRNINSVSNKHLFISYHHNILIHAVEGRCKEKKYNLTWSINNHTLIALGYYSQPWYDLHCSSYSNHICLYELTSHNHTHKLTNLRSYYFQLILWVMQNSVRNNTLHHRENNNTFSTLRIHSCTSLE